MRRGIAAAFGLSLLALVLVTLPLAEHLKNRPVQLKVGYVPESKVLRSLLADQRYLAGDWIITRVLFYFGGLLEKARGQNLYASAPDYPGMFRALQTGLRLEPYNADAYYFVQAVYTWDVARYREVNNMLEYGMKYRTWDSQLPFFAGFNAGYFLHDYASAAKHMQRAAEIAKEQQFATLAARYFHEAGQTDFAIAFINSMKESARSDEERKLYEYRLRALKAAREIELAVEGYRQVNHRAPRNIEELLASGLLPVVPRDPYGGRFYLDPRGTVCTTSQYSFAGAARAAKEGNRD